MGFVGLILILVTACAGTNAGVNNAGAKSGKVWVPANTGSHLGGSWVDVGETGSSNTGASNVQTASGAQLQAQQLQSQAPPSGMTSGGR
jgi:hypothetical protein